MHTISHLRENNSGTRRNRIASKLSQLHAKSAQLLHTVELDSSGDRHLACGPEAKTAQKNKHLYPRSANGLFRLPIQHQHKPQPLYFFGTELQPTTISLSSPIVIHGLYGVAHIAIDFCTVCFQLSPALAAELFCSKASSESFAPQPQTLPDCPHANAHHQLLEETLARGKSISIGD
jgi:hypothetical protein